MLVVTRAMTVKMETARSYSWRLAPDLGMVKTSGRERLSRTRMKVQGM